MLWVGRLVLVLNNQLPFSIITYWTLSVRKYLAVVMKNNTSLLLRDLAHVDPPAKPPCNMCIKGGQTSWRLASPLPLCSHSVHGRPSMVKKSVHIGWFVQHDFCPVSTVCTRRNINPYVARKRVRVWKLRVQMALLPEKVSSHTGILGSIPDTPLAPTT